MGRANNAQIPFLPPLAVSHRPTEPLVGSQEPSRAKYAARSGRRVLSDGCFDEQNGWLDVCVDCGDSRLEEEKRSSPQNIAQLDGCSQVNSVPVCD